MKKIYNILLLSIFAGFLFTACETDTDSNPILGKPTTFPLNVPAYAINNVYDLKNSTAVELTCSQPEYGFPVATTYKVQVSLDAEYVEANEEVKANYIELETTYYNTKIAVVASEINGALLSLWEAKNTGEDFPLEPLPVYFRLKAFVTGTNEGTCLSNIIELPKVLGSSDTAIELPTTMFLVGSMLNEWSVWKPMPQINSFAGEFWSMVYFEENATFKFGTQEEEYIGAEDPARVSLIDKAESGIKGASDGNITVPTAGWYVVHIKTTIDGNNYKFELSLNPAEVYLFGNTNGGVWDYDENWKFTNPDTPDGEFISPAMVASGEARMCIILDGYDWWRLEFTLYKDAIFYRENRGVNDGWAADIGADYSVQGEPGKKIHLNFASETGALK